jgi:hypothetical protein
MAQQNKKMDKAKTKYYQFSNGKYTSNVSKYDGRRS